MDFVALSAQMPVDWIILGATVAFLALDALRSGSGRTASLSLSLFAALFLYSTFEHATLASSFSEQLATPALRAALFISLSSVLFLMARRMAGNWGYTSGGPVQALCAGIAGSAILVVVWLSVPPLASVWEFGTQVQAVFAEGYRFWWVLGAFALLTLARS